MGQVKVAGEQAANQHGASCERDRPMAFQGSLKELPLPDIIQLVSVSGKTGRFALVREGEKGSIYLKNGQMVHAEVGDLTGEEAIYTLAIWNSGDFQFTPGEEPVRQSITKSNTNLLMEAARRLDEWRVLSKKIPSVDLVPVLRVRQNRHEPVTLDPQEWLLVTKIDGRQTIAELSKNLSLSSFEVAKVLYGMVTAELVGLDKKKTKGPEIPKADLLALANQIRGVAEQTLGPAGQKSIDKYYQLAVEAIQRGEGLPSVRGMIVEFEKAASLIGGVSVAEQLRTAIASLTS